MEYCRRLLSVCILALCSLTASALYADILITRDGMTLNGKVVENSPGQQLVFVNSYGSFTIQYSQIKELHITASYKEDIALMEDKGLQPDEDEYEKNYLAGARAKRDKTDNSRASAQTGSTEVFTGISYLRIVGRLAPKLSTGAEAFAGVYFPLGLAAPAGFGIDGIECSARMLYAKQSERSIAAISLSAGPRFSITLPLSSVDTTFDFVPGIGAGWYHITNGGDTVDTLKADFSLQAGPAFYLDSFVIAPRLKFVYIADAGVPLYALGVSIAGGYSF